MQTQSCDIRALCITRLKSDDFGLPRTRSKKPTPKLLGILLITMLTLAYLIVGGIA